MKHIKSAIIIILISFVNFSYGQKDSLNRELFKTKIKYFHYYKYRNYSDLIDLKNKGANINAQDQDGNTLLHLAVKYKNWDVIKLLCRNHANMDIKNNSGQTAFDIAERSSSKSIYDYLIDPVYDMYFYAKYGSFENLKEQIKKESDINKPDRFGLTVLDHAVCRKNNGVEIVKFLVKKGVNVNYNYPNILDIAILNDNINLAKYYSDPDSLKIHIRPLNVAISQHNLEMVKLLTENGTDLNSADYLDYVPIFYALLEKSKNKEIIRYLITKNININQTFWDNTTLLHYLCKTISYYEEVSYSDHEVVETVLKKGININAKDRESKTALHYAAGNIEAVKSLEILLKYKADQSIEDNNGHIALDIAIQTGNTEAIKLFLEQGADLNRKDQNNNNYLHIAASGKNAFGLIKYLIEKGFNVNELNKQNQSPLLLASEVKENYETIKLLINSGANVNIDTYSNLTPLYYTVKNKDLVSTKLLVESGANINLNKSNTGYVLTKAIESNNSNLIEYLINKGADLEDVDLVLPIKKYNKKLVDLLLKKGIDPNKKNIEDEAPLITASANGSYDIVELLINNGANIQISDRNFNSALLASISNNHLKIVSLLIDNNIDIKKRNSHKTPIHYAAENKDGYDIVKLLIDKGANVNVIDDYNMTPVHYALKNNNQKTAKLLKEKITKKKNQALQNSLLKDKLIVYDRIPLNEFHFRPDDNDQFVNVYKDLYFEYEDFYKIDLSRQYYDKLIKNQLKGYENYTSYLSYFEKDNIYNPPLSNRKIKENAGEYEEDVFIIDAETGEESLVKIQNETSINDLNGILFYDDWVYDETKFVFNKEVKSYSLIRRFYNEEFYDENIPLYNLISFLNFDNTHSKKNKQKELKNLDLFKKVKYEFLMNDFESYVNLNNAEGFDESIIKEKENSPFWTGFSRRKLIESIINNVLSGNKKAYDFISGSELSIPEIYERFDAVPDTVVFYEDWDEWESTKIIDKQIEINEIKSIIFIEEWFLDQNSMKIFKKVIGIAPVRWYYNHEDYDVFEFQKSIPFAVYFNDPQFERFDEKYITVNTPLDKNKKTMFSYFYKNQYYSEKNIGNISFKNLYFNKVKETEVPVFSTEFVEDRFLNYSKENYIQLKENEILNNFGYYQDTVWVIDPETGEEVEKIVKNNGYGIDSLAVLHSHEKWHYDKETFTFNKEIFSYAPGIRFYNSEIGFDEDRYKLTGYILNNTNKKMSDMTLFKKVKYEFCVEDPIINEVTIHPVLEEEKPLFWNNYSQNTFKEEIFKIAFDNKKNVYDFSTNKIVSKNELSKKLILSIDTIQDIDLETGEYIDYIVENKVGHQDINSFLFIENWYIDEKDLSIKKEVVGIAPVFYMIDNEYSDGGYSRYIPFVIYFDESKKF